MGGAGGAGGAGGVSRYRQTGGVWLVLREGYDSERKNYAKGSLVRFDGYTTYWRAKVDRPYFDDDWEKTDETMTIATVSSAGHEGRQRTGLDTKESRRAQKMGTVDRRENRRTATRMATMVGVPGMAAGASAASHVHPTGNTAPNDDDGESGGLAVLLAAVTDVVAQPALTAPTAPGLSLSHLDPAYQSITLARESNKQWWGGGGPFAAHGRGGVGSGRSGRGTAEITAVAAAAAGAGAASSQMSSASSFSSVPSSFSQGGGASYCNPLSPSLLFNRVIQQAKMQRQMQQQAMQHVTPAVRHLMCASEHVHLSYIKSI